MFYSTWLTYSSLPTSHLDLFLQAFARKGCIKKISHRRCIIFYCFLCIPTSHLNLFLTNLSHTHCIISFGETQLKSWHVIHSLNQVVSGRNMAKKADTHTSYITSFGESPLKSWHKTHSLNKAFGERDMAKTAERKQKNATPKIHEHWWATTTMMTHIYAGVLPNKTNLVNTAFPMSKYCLEFEVTRPREVVAFPSLAIFKSRGDT